MAPRTRAATAAILLSFTSLLRYVPDAIAVAEPAGDRRAWRGGVPADAAAAPGLV